MKKYGIKLYSIYDDLEKLSIQIGKRKEPLCKQIYGFKGDLTEAYDEGQKNENFQRQRVKNPYTKGIFFL